VNHLPFIAGAYGVTVIVMTAIVGWLLWDGRAVTRQLDALAARGIRRRSEGRQT
jgi:heme exporter protein D